MYLSFQPSEELSEIFSEPGYKMTKHTSKHQDSRQDIEKSSVTFGGFHELLLKTGKCIP